jgi:hypothetical protein
MKQELLMSHKIDAVCEELLGFINTQIIDKGGEFHDDGRPPQQQDKYRSK